MQPENEGNQAACDVAPSLSGTLADFAPQRAPFHRRFSMLKSRPRRPPAPTWAFQADGGLELRLGGDLSADSDWGRWGAS
jgi:hypothetical protein